MSQERSALKMLFQIFTLEDAVVKEMVSDLHLILNEF